jgi:uncharacterized protein
MDAALAYLGNLANGMLTTVLKTLAHNGWVLAVSIVTAVALKTYVNAEKLSRYLAGKTRVSIFLSVLVGAFTPFCACGTMAVIVGMLTMALPWGPIMAFLTSSPLMSPDGFLMLSGIIGLRFAVGLTVASLGIGLFAGFTTQWIERHTGILNGQARYAGRDKPAACACGKTAPASPTVAACSCSAALPTSAPALVRPSAARLAARVKPRELLDNFVNLGLKQILLYFSLFVAVGYLVNTFVPMSIVSALFGADSPAAVPLAALIGLPLYLTTESSIPLIQSLLRSGASEGAMMAFIISGSATSAWVIAGLSTFMKKKALGLYVAYILLGSVAAGYLYDLVLAAL